MQHLPQGVYQNVVDNTLSDYPSSFFAHQHIRPSMRLLPVYPLPLVFRLIPMSTQVPRDLPCLI